MMQFILASYAKYQNYNEVDNIVATCSKTTKLKGI